MTKDNAKPGTDRAPKGRGCAKQPLSRWMEPRQTLKGLTFTGLLSRGYSRDPKNPLLILENNNQVHWDPNNTRQVDGRKWIFKIDRSFNQVKAYRAGDTFGVNASMVVTPISSQEVATLSSRIAFGRIVLAAFSIKDAQISGFQVPCLATPGGGPQIGQPNDPRISGVIVEDCFFDSCGDDNVALFNVDGAIIRNTYSSSSFAANIKLYRCSDISVTNTEVANGYCLVREDYSGHEETVTGTINATFNRL